MELKIRENSIKDKSKIVRPDETDVIKCSNCNKKLATIFQKLLAKEAFYKLVIECPFCNDKSFERDIKGTVGVRPFDGITVVNIETDDEKMINFYRTRRV